MIQPTIRNNEILMMIIQFIKQLNFIAHFRVASSAATILYGFYYASGYKRETNGNRL